MFDPCFATLIFHKDNFILYIWGWRLKLKAIICKNGAILTDTYRWRWEFIIFIQNDGTYEKVMCAKYFFIQSNIFGIWPFHFGQILGSILYNRTELHFLSRFYCNCYNSVASPVCLWLVGVCMGVSLCVWHCMTEFDYLCVTYNVISALCVCLS